MSYNGCIIAIGKFNHNIKYDLEYPDEYYNNTKKGTTVLTHLCYCETSSKTEELANAINCEILNFNTHELNPNDFNYDILDDLFPDDISRLVKLVKNNFKFYFMPDG